MDSVTSFPSRCPRGQAEMLQCDKTPPGGRVELFPHECSEKPLVPPSLN